MNPAEGTTLHLESENCLTTNVYNTMLSSVDPTS